MAELKTGELELKILTFNIWGVWKYATRYLEKRLQLITEAINGYDIVNLQEVSVFKTREVLENNHFYPYKERLNNGSFLKWGSGLATLTRFPILEKKHIEFTSCAGPDCNNNKGIFFLRLAVPELGELDLYNTHYQSMPQAIKHRLKANRDFEKFYRENDRGNLTVVTGDFNLRETDPDYRDLLAKIPLVDTFRNKYPETPGYTLNKEKNPFVGRLSFSKRIDYIFMIPGEKNRVEVLESAIMFDQPREGIFLSDHFGLLTTLKIIL